MSRNAPRLSNDKVATILVEALFFGDARTAKKWGISKRTVDNYRVRLNNNTNGLVTVFKSKKELFEGEWANDIPVTVRIAMDYIRRASNELDITPEGVHAIAGALKIIAEVGLTKEMIDVRLQEFRHTGEDKPKVRQMDTGSIIEGETN